MNLSEKMNIQVTSHPPVSLQFEIPNVLADFIRKQTTEGGFKSEGEYLLDLVERDRIRAAREELEIEILKGIKSGPGVVVTKEFWQKKRQELEARLQKPDSAP